MWQKHQKTSTNQYKTFYITTHVHVVSGKIMSDLYMYDTQADSTEQLKVSFINGDVLVSEVNLYTSISSRASHRQHLNLIKRVNHAVFGYIYEINKMQIKWHIRSI